MDIGLDPNNRVILRLTCTYFCRGQSACPAIFKEAGQPSHEHFIDLSEMFLIDTGKMYSQTCVKRLYKTRYISGFSDRWLLIAV